MLLEVVFHPDVRRIGDVTVSGALEAGELIVGRKAPLFFSPDRPGPPRPLEDPCVSRNQLVIYWRSAVGAFTVHPHPAARMI